MRWFIKAIPAAQHAIVIVAIAAIVVTAYFVAALVADQRDVIEQQRAVLDRQERVLERREAELEQEDEIRADAVRRTIRRVEKTQRYARTICESIPECELGRVE